MSNRCTLTPEQQTLLNNMQAAIECTCTNGDDNNMFCRSMAAGELLTTEPFNCMVQVINDQSVCGTKYPENVTTAAYNAYTDVTGVKPLNMNQIFQNLYNQQNLILNFNSFYIFMPILILIILVVILGVGFKWIHWPVGLYIITFSFVILYGFSIGYRIHGETFLKGRNKNILQETEQYQKNYEESIAYLPQAIFAVACAVANNGDPDSWKCNPPPCPPCNNQTSRTKLRQ